MALATSYSQAGISTPVQERRFQNLNSESSFNFTRRTSCKLASFNFNNSSPKLHPLKSLSVGSSKSQFLGNNQFGSYSNVSSAPIKSSNSQAKIVASAKPRPLKVIISGAPASGKGTQCEEIVEKYGLVHISAGDLLRYEVANNTEYGKQVKSYMDSGKLVPDEVVITIVKDRLSQPDATEKGWLLDGYPRSASQAAALEKAKIEPEIFILLEVPDEILVDRVVGRRLDPITNKIYHLTYSPPENDTIASRLTQRSDDTEEKVKLRLQTHKDNVEAVLSSYDGIIKSVDGNRPKQEVFNDINTLLHNLSLSEEKCLEDKETNKAKDNYDFEWKGVPTRLNFTPHSREIRKYFYKDVCKSTLNAVNDGKNRLRVQVTFPELNPEMDVYRIGTLLELMRELAFTFAKRGKNVKVCVQGKMGEGIFAGMPLQLSGTRRMLELMDWDGYDGKESENEIKKQKNITIASVGEKEVNDEDEVFVIMAPQNAIANCIIDDLEAMANAAKDRPFIIINPRLKDIPGSGGVMQVQGREKRLEFVSSFFTCYNFRLLYLSGTQYPILGALRMAYPSPYEVYKRIDMPKGVEKYELMDTFENEPKSAEIGDAFEGRKTSAGPKGFWKILSEMW